MRATSEPILRPVEVSEDLIEVPRKGAHSSSTSAPARIVSDATSPPNQEPPAVERRWKPFADLGLLPSAATQTAQKLIVTTYRLLGLFLLSLVVVVLVGYITVTTFYFFNRSWVAPVAISPNDEQVVTLRSQLAAQLNTRAALVGELEQAERAIAAEQAFHLQFIKAIKNDLAARKVALGRVRALSTAAGTTRNEIRATNGDFSESTFKRMNDDYSSGMIDRQAMLAGKYTLAQISNANLALAERQAEYDQRAAELAVQTRSLDAVLANEVQTAALSYEVLEIAREYETSKLALAREESNRDRLRASIGRQDQIIAGIQQSAYLRAVDGGATVALVPYVNLHNAGKGSPLYSCKLDMVLCREVGKVVEVLPGEVQIRHPSRDMLVRGRMIVMETTDRAAAEESVLFAGSKPLWF